MLLCAFCPPHSTPDYAYSSGYQFCDIYEEFTSPLQTLKAMLRFSDGSFRYEFCPSESPSIAFSITRWPTLSLEISPRARTQVSASLHCTLPNHYNSPHSHCLSGVQLKEFFDAVDQVLSGIDVPRIMVYSAHDINVFTFSSITRINPRLSVPKYGSLFSLELRRDLITEEYIVVVSIFA